MCADSNEPTALRELGGLWLQAGGFERALEMLGKATEVSPGDARGWVRDLL